MRPGQQEPNELELAILERMATRHPTLREHLGQLHVLSREFTGVGSFTAFICESSEPKSHIGMDGIIHIPDAPSGLGAVLFLRGGRPECLEVFSYVEPWDGTFDGFSIV